MFKRVFKKLKRETKKTPATRRAPKKPSSPKKPISRPSPPVQPSGKILTAEGWKRLMMKKFR